MSLLFAKSIKSNLSAVFGSIVHSISFGYYYYYYSFFYNYNNDRWKFTHHLIRRTGSNRGRGRDIRPINWNHLQIISRIPW